MKRSGTLCVAALVAAGLVFAPLPAALADQPAQTTTNTKPRVKKHHAQLTQQAPTVYSPQRDGCTWPYKNQIPPCMGTWPAGDPNYHGSRPGPIPGE